MIARRWIRLAVAAARAVQALVVAAARAVQALVMLAVIEVLLRVTDLPATCRVLRVELDVSSAAAARTATVVLPAGRRRAVRAASAVVSRWPLGDTCLRRCLLLGHILRGVRPVLRIGVKRDAGTFAAHAWLEIDGVTLDASAVEYAALGAGEGRA